MNTTKDFEAAAKMLREKKLPFFSEDTVEESMFREACARVFADFFTDSNPQRFDRNIFLKACLSSDNGSK